MTMLTIRVLAPAFFAAGLFAQGSKPTPPALPTALPKITVNGRALDTSRLTANRVSAEQIFRMTQKRAPSGAADEAALTKLIDDSRCERLISLIEDAIVRQQMEKFGVTATEAEKRSYLAKFPELAHPESIAAQTRERGLALRDGFAEVFEKGQSPEAVYPKLAARLGYTKEVWLVNVEQARDPARRADIYKWMIEATPERVRSAIGGIDAAHAVRLAKLKRLIYEDPSMKSFHRMPPGAIVVNPQDAVFHNFLQAEMKRTTVTLDNKAWHNRCGLAKLGLHVPGAGQ